MRLSYMIILLFFTFYPALVFGQTGSIKGIIKDSETGLPLDGANVGLSGTIIGTTSNQEGQYLLSNVPNGNYTINVSFLGYKVINRDMQVNQTEIILNFQLLPTILRGQELIVTATRAIAGETPVAFSTITKEDIKARYYAQDIPVLLSELPSTTFYSESGNGIGYNHLSIRGFDQRRISVMINGIPQNDPEDHNIYWLDFPDLLGNVEDIQVQRGAGSAFYGPPAIGGSLNIITSRFDPDKKISVYSGVGNFNTQKYSLSVNSGLLKDRYIISGRISQIKSDGYRDRSWVNFKSFFLGLARFGKKSSLRLNIYGGPIEDHLVFYGISKEAALDRNKRKQNPITREDEIENFNQPHAELIHSYQINNKLTLNNSLFAIRGYGFFDYNGSWAPMSYFRITPEFGFDLDDDPDSSYVDRLLIRAYVDNRQIGWLPNLTWKFKKTELVIGSEIRFHRSLHWGRIQNGSSNLPLAISGDYLGHNYIGKRRYYQYKGAKNIISPYIHTGFYLRKNLNLMFDMQLSYKKYSLFDEQFIGTDFDISYYFFNPRSGINYTINEQMNIFTSYSRTSREPRLKNFYDAAEASTPSSWGAVLPQFERYPDGSFNFDRPFVKPETLNDFELGLSYKSFGFFGNINLFYMDFNDEIIKNGQLDRFGQPVTGNAKKSLHQGIELSGGLQISANTSAIGNLMLSKNELKNHTIFSSGGDKAILNGNPIAGFPDILANARINYHNGSFNATIAMQHIGKKYTDNLKNEKNRVDAYTIFNGAIGYDLGQLAGIRGLTVRIHAQNISNVIYIAHGEGESFFPGAERQLFLSTNVEF